MADEPVKRYDREYFDHWYRRSSLAGQMRQELRRQVAFAVAITEMVAARPLESVLDVGAGEGRWQPELARLRPKARYAGVEPSEWAVGKWGRRRNLRLGSFANLDELGLDGPFDLVVAADVLHYLPRKDLSTAVAALVPWVGAVAFCPLFTADDDIEGDGVEFQERGASVYRRVFREAGLTPIGMGAWVPDAVASGLSALELPVGD